MAASDNIGTVKTQWPKWLIALAIGAAPVSLCVGYYYLKRRDARAEVVSKKDVTEKNIANGTTNETSPTPAINDNTPKQELPSQTPLERAQAIKNSGNELFKRNEYQQAIKCYTEAILLCPPNEKKNLAMFYQNRAAAHENLNNVSNALADCNKALELDAGYVKALNRRCKMSEKVGDLRQALEDVTAICILEGFENMSTLNLADKLLKKLGIELAKEKMKNRVLVWPSKHFVMSYLQQYVNDPLSNCLKEANEPSGDAQIVGFLAAKKAFHEGKYDDVIQHCNEQIKQDQESGGNFGVEHYLARLLRATIYLLSTVPHKAFEDINTIISEKSVDDSVMVNALVKRASLHIQMEKLEQCLEDFATAQSIDPNNCDIYQHRGQIYLFSENLPDALADYEKAVELAPNFSLAIVQRLYTIYRSGSAQNDLEKTKTATEQLAQAAEQHPDIPEGCLLLGQVYADQQQYEEAEKAFDKAIQRNPHNATAFVHKGLLELQWHNSIEKAIEFMNEALKVDDKCQFAYETLASIEVQRGNLAKAVELFAKALALAKNEREMLHICSLKAAAEAQQVVVKKLGIPDGFAQKV